MRIMKAILSGLSVALLALTANSNSHAQSVVFNATGSSALYLELGEAAQSLTAVGTFPGCLWTKSSGTFSVSDSHATGLVENGQEWVAWTPDATSGSCSTVSSSTQVYAYQQTDSVIGDRCLFNGCTMTNTALSPNNGTSNLIHPSSGSGPIETASLPSGIANKLGATGSAAVLITAAGTDIRPEDALFATVRATTACGTAVATGSQYLGLGYASGNSIESFYSSAVYHVVSFSLPAHNAFNIHDVGASPIIVAVAHNGGGTSGFGDPLITNMNSGVLANFLDGSYSQTGSAHYITNDTSTSEPVTVLLREPLSGTYNTLEYNVPNSVENQTSQDVGSKQQTAQRNCPTNDKLNIMTAGVGGVHGFRNRVIGTGESLTELFSSSTGNDVLGYAFWGVSNFKNAPANAKYLTIDGVDPLQDSYTTGAIPTPTTSGGVGFAAVTLSHVQDGSYPAWSKLRIVDIGGASGAAALATAAQNFVSFGTSTSEPDFIPVSSTTFPSKNLGVVRSHFLPPVSGEPTAAANGTGTTTEAGGDVGGVVYTIKGDTNFNTDFAVQTGETGRRR